jgi:WD40 repeat protein
LAFGDGGGPLIVGESDGRLKVWDGRALRPIAGLGPGTGAGGPAAISKITVHGQRAAVATSSGDAQVVDLDSHRTAGLPVQGARALVWNPDGRHLYVGSSDRTIYDFSADGDGFVLKGRLTGHVDEVTDLAVTPEDSLLISTSEDTTVRFWDLDTDGPIGNPVRWSGEFASAIALDAPQADRGYVAFGDEVIAVASTVNAWRALACAVVAADEASGCRLS